MILILTIKIASVNQKQHWNASFILNTQLLIKNFMLVKTKCLFHSLLQIIYNFLVLLYILIDK